MHLVHLVALLAIIQFMAFSFLVGVARDKYGVKAPAISGNETFERVFRVQMNTLEQLVGFLPALFLASLYWPDRFVAVVGLVYLIGRMIYRHSYIKDPSGRAPGFLMTVIPTFVLLVAGLIGALLRAPA